MSYLSSHLAGGALGCGRDCRCAGCRSASADLGEVGLGCGGDCRCRACRTAGSPVGCQCHGSVSGLGERYIEDDDDDEPGPPRQPPGPGRMRTGVAGFGCYGGFAQTPVQLPRPSLLQPRQPGFRPSARLMPGTLQMPPYATIDGFGPNRWQLTAHQVQAVQGVARLIAASWRTMSPVTSLRVSAFMANTETTPQLDSLRARAVRDALVVALMAQAPNLPQRIRWEPDEPRGVSAMPRVDIFARMGVTPPPAHTPAIRIPPPSEVAARMVQPETPEQRINRLLRSLPPAPPRRGRSVSQWFWNEVDTRLNAAMRRMNIPESLQPHIRAGAHAAIERGAEAIFNQVLDAGQITGEPREALSATVRALLQTPVQ